MIKPEIELCILEKHKPCPKNENRKPVDLKKGKCYMF